MNDDDYIMLDARIDGLREAIAALVRTLPERGANVAVLRMLLATMEQNPTHLGAKEQVQQLIDLLEEQGQSGEAVEGDGQRHSETTPA